ncbi:uncharacterized protein EDB93DRAFT_1308727 [Suillus bovinus]|uniref:uncharacterized protein n=1 Tax=Suillus bovinus TaxID=48563 RepID=UPI001B86419C|nr:uncharacterized protein EDB93DRAFT_1308727 [Suillus bovinus]KAG2133203.1 hypothetical protein EDB93DRAFT_1308727 [Suillus bovinus]
MAITECFNVDDVASRVISAVVGATLDNERLVCDQAFKAVKLFIKRLEAHTLTVLETAFTEDSGEDLPARLPGAFTQAGLATGAAAALTGRAVSSLGKKAHFILFIKTDSLRYPPLSLPLLTCK